MALRAVRAVILDMGGVLMPELTGYEETARDERLLTDLRSLGIDDPAALVLDRARRVRSAYRELGPACVQPELDRVLADTAPAVRKRLLLAFAQHSAPRTYAHAREVVRTLASRYRLALVSNNVIPGDAHARRLRLEGILPHFEIALWSANFGRRKPDPAMIRHVLARFGVPARDAIFVGDKPRTDVRAAHAAGLRCVLLRTRWTGTDGPDERPEFVIRDLRELPLLLARIAPLTPARPEAPRPRGARPCRPYRLRRPRPASPFRR